MSEWLSETQKDQILTLGDEITMFSNFIQLNEYEQEIRNKCFQDLKTTLISNIQNIDVSIYGSFPEGLSIPLSDIDVVVMTKEAPTHSRTMRTMKRVLRCIQSSQQFTLTEYLSHARVPILKVTDNKYSINIDISVNCSSGIDSCNVGAKLLKQYAFAKPMLLTIKFFLYQNSMNEPYKGGIGSYALLLLICTYLKVFKPNDLGDAFIGFMKFYGNEFQMFNQCVNIHKGFEAYKQMDKSHQSPYIVDPAESGNNVGRSSYNFKTIQYHFKQIAKLLNKDNKKYLPKSSVLLRFIAIPTSLVAFRDCVKEVALNESTMQKKQALVPLSEE